MGPFASVILPIRNESRYIKPCLQALFEQTYDSSCYEILVVDGLSTDETRAIVNSLIKKYKNSEIFLLDNPKQTVPYALNIGLEKAKGEIIIRVDGHAIVEEDYIEQCVAVLDETGADCVGGPITSVNNTLIGKGIALAMSSSFGVGNSYFRTTPNKARYVDTLAFPAFRREIFDKIGKFDEEFVRAQDEEFNYRLNKFGGKIFLSPKIKSRYFPRSNFKKLWRQYFQYGYYKIRVLQRHFRMMNIRHFVPGAFVLSLVVTGSIGLIMKPAFVLFSLILLAYLSFAFSYSFLITFNNGLLRMPIVFLSYIMIHFGYGIGFLTGLIKFSNNWTAPFKQNLS